MAVDAYPLTWPKGWTRENGREASRFGTNSKKAHALLMAEVARMGGTNIILSTNVPLTRYGVMDMGREPVDPGAAVYFTRDGKQMVFACDRYSVLRDNIMSIAKTIEAMRGIERWGASSMMERAFSGFGLSVQASAPAPVTEELWWDVLDVSRTASADVINAAFRVKAKAAHPDRPGGSYEAMQRLNAARDRGLKERGA